MNIEKTLNDIKEYAELLDKYRALEKENKNLKEKIMKLQIEIWWLMWERDGKQMRIEKLEEELKTVRELYKANVD